MSMKQRENESAHDYAVGFQIVLEKIPHYEESWFRNLLILGAALTLSYLDQYAESGHSQ